MKKIVDIVESQPWFGWFLFTATLVGVFLLGLFGASIMERRQEAVLSRKILKPIALWEPRNEVWGRNYPREYETYKKTADSTFASKYQGSIARDILAERPNLVILWAGYPFARDYKQARGHAHAITDIRESLRTGLPMPGSCWTCKSTDAPRVINQIGVAEFYKKSWIEQGGEFVNAIGCQDCHDPATMNLRVSRPALAEAFQRMGLDIAQTSHQQMRSLVCAQCHVEYYFKGKEEKYLTFPWDKGFSAEDMEAYYDAGGHVDWQHALSRAPMLKAQHPDYELYRTGIHAERGVACADCHMPYRSEGGVKFTDHHIRSPLSNIGGSCAVCHRESEATLTKNVYDRQDKIMELLKLAEDALVAAHIEAKAAWDAGASEAEMSDALILIRHAQWRWDWVGAANGVGFHSPLECARILGGSIQKAEAARRIIAGILITHKAAQPITMPDLNTKKEAQSYLGLDMDKFQKEKEVFLRDVVQKWLEQARAREASYE
jgi:nitrite reductase (cytochrome c-552)